MRIVGMDRIAEFRQRYGFGADSELARRADLSEADQAEFRRFFELRSQYPEESDDEIIARVLGL